MSGVDSSFSNASLQKQIRGGAFRGLGCRAGGQAYFQARNDAVRQIEATISELSGMFQEFARIVAEQDELIMRCGSHAPL